MQLFVEQLLNGIGLGVVYGSVALALVMIFRSTGLLNFAQGEMAMFSTYLSWKFSEEMPVVMAILLSMALAFVAGAAIERLLIRPVEEARNPLNVVIVTLGMFLGLNALAQLFFGTDPQGMPAPWPRGDGLRLFTSGGNDVDIGNATLALIVVLVVECLVLWLLFQKTRLGLRMRAVASNPESSRLMGINTGLILMIGWGLAAAVGALAGTLAAARQEAGAFDSTLMQVILVYAFAAAALGGFESLVGAVVAGLIVGVSQTLSIEYIEPLEGIALVVPLALILGVLLVKPAGLFGRRTVERV
jgi:branched-chain amino acid transport system permease protein